jgi:predicted aconitase with swiveling domain
MTAAIKLNILVEGSARAPLLVLQESLSFWGGLNPDTAEIIDTQHPNRGESIKGCCLVMPGIRGSTAAPGALLECICGGNGPAAIVLAESDATPLISSLVASFMGYTSVPVAVLQQPDDMARLETGRQVELRNGALYLANG